MIAILLLTSLIFPAQGQTKPQAPTTVTGKWTLALEIQGTTATPTLDLTQNGEKVTGFYQGRYGKFALTGTLKVRQLEFSFTMNAEGTDVVMTFKGEVSPDFQVMRGVAVMAEMGEAPWTAKRTN
jgi:hypothetical protein